MGRLVGQVIRTEQGGTKGVMVEQTMEPRDWQRGDFAQSRSPEEMKAGDSRRERRRSQTGQNPCCRRNLIPLL